MCVSESLALPKWMVCIVGMEGILQSASGRSQSADKGLPDPRLRDGDPGVLRSPKTGTAPSPNMDSSSFARHQTRRAGLNQKEAKTDKHRTLFLSSKCIQVQCYKKIMLLSISSPKLYSIDGFHGAWLHFLRARVGSVSLHMAYYCTP